MYEKLRTDSNLFEHEVLEILLYNAFPRKDTNPIAHALLARFPSLNAVFSAEIEELTSVEGVGEQTALYLKCIGMCLKLINYAECFAVLKTRSDLYEFVRTRLSGLNVENLELYALDKGSRVTRIELFTSEENDKVEIQPDTVMRFVTNAKPHSLVIAHNHTGTGVRPSNADDDCTKQVQIVCSMNNVNLRDHVIVDADNNIYSYYESGRLNEILAGFTIANLLRNDKKDKENR